MLTLYERLVEEFPDASVYFSQEGEGSEMVLCARPYHHAYDLLNVKLLMPCDIKAIARGIFDDYSDSSRSNRPGFRTMDMLTVLPKLSPPRFRIYTSSPSFSTLQDSQREKYMSFISAVSQEFMRRLMSTDKEIIRKIIVYRMSHGEPSLGQRKSGFLDDVK